MRVLLTTTSGIGHLHPLIPLARASAEAGDEVRVAAPSSLAGVLAARALPHLALPDYDEHHLARVEAAMRRLGTPGPGYEADMLREVFGWAKTDSTLEAMRTAVARWQPDVVLHEAAELAGPLAAEEAGIPHATVAIGLRRTMETLVGFMTAGADEVATAHGLPADPTAHRVLGVPFLTMTPPTLDGMDPSPEPVTLRYQLTDLHARGTTSATDLRGTGPLVWIGLGTEAWRVPGVMERILPVLAGMAADLPQVRFLLTTGSAEMAPAGLPANVRVETYVPQEQLLAASDAVIGHGGYNTTIAALAAGRPW